MRVLVTRPEPDATAQADLLRARGLTPIVSPLLAVTFLPLSPEVVTRSDGYAAAMVTSRNALRSLKQNGCPDALKSIPLFCVGPATAACARTLGFSTVIEGEGTAEAVQRALVTYVKPEGARVLRLTGETPSSAPERLDHALREAGYAVDVAKCYRILPRSEFSPEAQTALESGLIDLVILMSPLTARTYLAASKDAALTLRSDKPSYLCISQAVADAIVGFPQSRVFVADKPNQSGLLSVIDQAVAELS